MEMKETLGNVATKATQNTLKKRGSGFQECHCGQEGRKRKGMKKELTSHIECKYYVLRIGTNKVEFFKRLIFPEKYIMK